MEHEIKVLIVDDSSDDRFILARALRKTGFSVAVFEAEDGAEAIDFLSHQGGFADPATYPKPEVIFLDLKMPVKNGFDVLHWMRERTFQPPIRVVVVSGSELDQDIRLAHELGADRYLTKPVTADQLRISLASVSKLAA